MKLILLGSLLVGGGSAIAMQDETINENVTGLFEGPQNHRCIDGLSIAETGFPYPSDEFLSTLSEEQQTAIISFVDQVNATYDFSTMTEEELRETVQTIRDEMKVLFEELEIDPPQRHQRELPYDTIRENGFTFPNDRIYDLLTEEQAVLLDEFITTVNETYDFAAMTDEEIDAAVETIKTDLETLFDELGVELPAPRPRHRGGRGHHRGLHTVTEDTEEQNAA